MGDRITAEELADIEVCEIDMMARTGAARSAKILKRCIEEIRACWEELGREGSSKK